VSQLLESLRRGGTQSPGSPGQRMADSAAVLATLGYVPPRSSRGSRKLVHVLVLLAVLAIVIAGWSILRRS
jgi:hypothetical protein